MAVKQYGNVYVQLPSGVELNASELTGDNEHTDQVIRSISCDDDVPVIILLGWAGCVDRHLQKYSAIYNKKYVTIRFTALKAHGFMLQRNNRGAALQIARLIVKLRLERHPLFVHVFSNGGGRIYRYFTELIHSGSSEFKHFHLTGTIFDSCPSRRRVITSIKVFLVISNYPVIIKHLLAAFLFIILCIIAALKSLDWYFPSLKSIDDYFDYLQEDPAQCPQLYLFSYNDEVVPFLDVEWQIFSRRCRKVKVKTQTWNDSRHVSHLLDHREAYIAACLRFIEFCITQ